MSNVTPWAFLSIFLVRIPKKEICSIFGNRDDIGHKHKKGFMDYQSIKITKYKIYGKMKMIIGQ